MLINYNIIIVWTEEKACVTQPCLIYIRHRNKTHYTLTLVIWNNKKNKINKFDKSVVLCISR